MKNEMSDTPRTDIATDFTAPEKLLVCSKLLERELAAAIAERDEARKERDYWNVMYRANESCRLRDNAELLKQRDEARECLREVLRGLEDLCKHIGHKNPRKFKDFNRWRAAAGMEIANEP